jgi:replicative DNA helicase
MEGSAKMSEKPTKLFSLEAEEGVLGSMLEDEGVIDEVITYLGDSPKVFFLTSHQIIYDAICTLRQEGRKADLLSVAALLKETGKSNTIGGVLTLKDLKDSVPTAANALHYAKIVKEKHLKRQLISRMREVANMCQEDEAVEIILDSLDDMIRRVAEEWEKTESIKSVGEIVDEIILEAKEFRDGERMIMHTGFVDLDNIITGFHSGQFIIVAGRPSVGKSTFVHNLVAYIAAEASQPRPVLVFSIEEDRREVVKRLMVSRTSLTMKNFYRARSDEDMKRIIDGGEAVKNIPVYIKDFPKSLGEIAGISKYMKLRIPEISLIIVDYLQLLMPQNSRESENRLVSEISAGLKRLAGELRVPLIAVSQLSRAPEHRADSRPKLSDLRSSGSLEQDADIVIFLWREDYENYEEGGQNENENPISRTEVIVAKNRNGPTGKAILRYNRAKFRFENF